MNELIHSFTENPLAQIIGFVALSMAFLSFQQNTHKGIMGFQTVGSSIFAVHFFMLGAYTGSLLNIASALRDIVFLNKDKKWARNKIWLWGFLGLFAAICVFTWEGPVSLLPFIGCAVFTVSFWIDNPKTVRRISWIASPCWMVYNVVNNSWAGVITEIIALSSIFIGMLRFDFKKTEKI